MENTPNAFAAQLVDSYHAELKECMPEILRLAEKVEAAHAGHVMCPTGLALYFRKFWHDLEAHLDEEDKSLFPLLAEGRVREAPVIRVMEEHMQQSHALSEIRTLCKDYELPDDACPTWKALYQSLEELELELLEHIQIENGLLFESAMG